VDHHIGGGKKFKNRGMTDVKRVLGKSAFGLGTALECVSTAVQGKNLKRGWEAERAAAERCSARYRGTMLVRDGRSPRELKKGGTADAQARRKRGGSRKYVGVLMEKGTREARV